jgi:2-keto-4-pentenoate hydratase/2-oxohepta-3-ene-1,7-dioic acid hydratase in catechol pathway
MGAGFKPSDETLPLADISLLPPCVPTKAVCVGLNYREHAAELSMEVPEEPVLFMKPPSSLCASGGVIRYPSQTQNLHYEAELAIVIGTQAKDVPESEAHKHILGYTCANDVTARDIQARDGQWVRAKSFDTFLPLGPCIETEFDPSNAVISLRLNGETCQHSTTADFIFPVSYLVSFVSQVMTLIPGDVILTGTPPGVGPMEKGDRVEVDIQGIGVLENVVG